MSAAASAQPRIGGMLCGLALLLASTLAPVQPQITPGESYLTPKTHIDKAPRLSGDFVTWTQDAGPLQSWGRVKVKRLSSGEEWDLGPGFASDVARMHDGAAGPEGCLLPEARAAWLRFDPQSGQLDLMSACLRAGSWSTELLAADLAWAGDVAVCQQFTAWVAPDAAGRITLFVHDGTSAAALSGSGHAFRPAFVRHPASGRLALLWDEYLGSDGGALDYEVFLRDWRPGQGWEPAQNLSNAPGSTDLHPSADFAPDGSLWIAWQSDRDDIASHVFVTRRRPNGVLEHPRPYPADPDPAAVGNLHLQVVRATYTPTLRVDAAGRPWVFVHERQSESAPGGPYDKEIRYSIYDGQAWTDPVLLSLNLRDELHLDAERHGPGLRVVYQSNSFIQRSVEVAVQVLQTTLPVQPLDVLPPAGPPLPHQGYPLPALPAERLLTLGPQTWRLVFGDLHSHTERSPDGMGHLDHALFWARDQSRLDFWASTDHDERGNHELTDWQYAMGRRFVDLFDAPDFTAFIGFEWTSSDPYGPEIIGHRATFDSAKLYRNTDDDADSLEEFYTLMTAEDAIGVPHHLGKLGGATFLAHDPVVQPITEISSVHGIFEDELLAKYQLNERRFGITSAGDDHDARPGMSGIAGTWIPAAAPLSRAAVKQALRTRRTFGVRRHGAWLDVRVNGAPPGSAIAHHGALLVEYELREAPAGQAYTVNITREGDHLSPLYAQTFAPDAPLAGVAVLPAESEPSWYMLRLSKGESTAPKDTILWATPVWVDPEPPSGYPKVAFSTPGTLGSDTAHDEPLYLHVTAPGGAAQIAELRVFVVRDDGVHQELPGQWLLEGPHAAPVPGGWRVALPDLQLTPGSWTLIASVEDRHGNLAVDSVELVVEPAGTRGGG